MSETEEQPLPRHKRWWGITLIAFATFFVGFGMGDSADTTETPAPTTISNEAAQNDMEQKIQDLTEALVDAKADAKAPQAAVEAVPDPEPEPATKTFSDGTHLVGTDIPAGRYKGKKTGSMAYWGIQRDANGEDTISNDIPSGDFYVEVVDGQFLKISGAEITLVE